MQLASKSVPAFTDPRGSLGIDEESLEEPRRRDPGGRKRPVMFLELKALEV